MANTYDTSMFPLGSTEVKVLFNNASNADEAVNDLNSPSWVDRFGNLRKTWHGIEQDAANALIAGGFEFIGDYDAPGELTFTRANQVMSKSGEYWRPAASLTLPYTTVNNWVIDQPKFVSTGDASLRQALASTDPLLGVSLAYGGVRYVTSYAALQALPKTGTPNVMVFAPGIAGQFQLDPADTTSPQIYGITMVAADGGRWKRVITDTVKSSWFGAKGDRVTDDTVALQAGLDYCNSFTHAKPFEIVGGCRITSSLFIDRPVTMKYGEEFWVTASGEGGGIYVDTAITMFSSRLPYGVNPGPTYSQDPPTEYTRFNGVRFEASDDTLAAYIFDSKYLRLTLSNCSGRKIKALASGQYMQSIVFDNCRWEQHTGTFFFATDLYDVVAMTQKFERSGAAFAWGGVARKCKFDARPYEGSSGPFVTGTGTVACEISGYFESNGAPDIVLGSSGGGANGVMIHNTFHLLTSAQFADPLYFPIVLGIGEGFDITACSSSGNLANNNSVLPFGLKAGNNGVGANRVAFSSNPFQVSGLTAHAGGGQASATAVTREITIFTVVGTAGDSAVLPAVKVMEKIKEITVVNRGALTMAIFPAIGERFVGLAVNASMNIASGASYRFVRESGDAWIAI